MKQTSHQSLVTSHILTTNNWLLVTCLTLALSLTLLTTPSHASDLFTIESIPVNQTGKDATEARALAMAQAESEAFKILMQKIADPNQQASLPPLAPTEISAMVRGFEVANEKITGTGYSADFTINFNPAAVRAYVQQSNLPFVERTPQTPTLILPILQTETGPVLWEEPNPWREAWNHRESSSAVTPVALPLGDLNDITAADTQTATTKDFEKLRS